MATKTNLEAAVEKQAGNLPPAQRELVMSQLKTYLWNKKRIREIEDVFRIGKISGEPINDKVRKSLMTERHQLSVDNVSISTKLFMQLKNTFAEEDEFDAFLKG